jgi:hypothetical protein
MIIQQMEECTIRTLDKMAAIVVEQESEQQLTIDSLVDLLGQQQNDHENHNMAQLNKIC